MRTEHLWADCFLNVSVEALSCVLLNSLNPLCTVRGMTSHCCLLTSGHVKTISALLRLTLGARLGTCRWCSLLKEMNLENPFKDQERPKQGPISPFPPPRFLACLSGTFIETRLLQSDLNTGPAATSSGSSDQSRLLVSRAWEPEPGGGGGRSSGWRSDPRAHGQQRSVSTWRAAGAPESAPGAASPGWALGLCTTEAPTIFPFRDPSLPTERS